MTDTLSNSKPKKEAIDNTQLLADSGLSIVHINNPHFNGRKMTIAYERINKSHIRLSTAVTHKSDTFEKKVGTKKAIENFQAGNTVIIPLSSDYKDNVASQLKFMFGYITN